MTDTYIFHSHSTADPLYLEKLKDYDIEYLQGLINSNQFDTNRMLFIINTYRKFDLKKMIEIEQEFRTKYNCLACPSFMYNSWVNLRKANE